MRDQDLSILIVTTWGCLAAVALFTQSQIPAIGSTVSALADAESPFAIIEAATLKRDRQGSLAGSTSAMILSSAQSRLSPSGPE
jgi:hypothetical protein